MGGVDAGSFEECMSIMDSIYNRKNPETDKSRKEILEEYEKEYIQRIENRVLKRD